MKPSTFFLLLAVGGVTLPQTSQGQRIASPEYALFRPAATPSPARPVSFIHSSAPDYRWEGLVIGGVSVAALATAFMVALCSDPDFGGGCAGPVVEGMLLGGTAGGFAGTLVGILIPKSHLAATD